MSIDEHARTQRAGPSCFLKRRAPGTDIAIIEPSHEHYYQPAFTLVGAGSIRWRARDARKKA